MRDERRRPPRDMQHALTVHGEFLQVRCVCGMVVGGARYADRHEISLSDLTELVRLHWGQINHGE